jgi:gluconokinase
MVLPQAAQQPLILSLDVGTSSVRAMLFDRTGDSISGMESQRAHQMRNTADGGVETDARALFERLAACIDDVLERAGGLAPAIRAVAPTTFWHNVLGVSARGEPLTPLLTWADTRASGAAADLRSELDTRAIHARSGCVLHPSYLPAKLRWLQTESRWKRVANTRVRHWLSFAEYVTLRLFGAPRCSISMASGTGLLDQHTCQWDAELLGAIPIDGGALSVICDAPLHGMRSRYAKRWPVLTDLPWFPGWGDGATNNVGSGCVSKSKVAMMVGTSGAMRAVFSPRRLRIPDDLWCYRVDGRRVVMGGALSNGGNFIDWLRANLRLPSDRQELESLLAGAAPDQSGLTILPFLAGERSTGWHSDARATFSGLSLHTDAADLYRAGHEAIAYRFALIFRLLREELRSSPMIVASGGGLLHSPAWLRIMTDVLNVKVVASAVSEASSRGAALLALEGIGAIADIEGIDAPLGQAYHPERLRARTYRHAALRQALLYDELVCGEPLVAAHASPGAQ